MAISALFLTVQSAAAVLLVDPNDGRSWQGATVGTFANLYYGANTLANRQLVITNQLLDDGIFDPTGYSAASLIANSNGGGCLGQSHDSTGTGSYAYTCLSGASITTHANSIDNLWFQTDGGVGETVFDLGAQSSKAAVFNAIDHGPLPGEAIESTVYLSNDQITWTLAVVERVWLEGFDANTDILWDGFVYAVGTGTTDTFQYASIIHGGEGALVRDGDNEINGVLGLNDDFVPTTGIPEPATLAVFGIGLVALGRARRRRKVL